MKLPALLPRPGLIALAAAALTLSSCVTTSTVESRIAARPEAYTALSASHRALIDQGRIAEGMSRDAVFFAWGAPDAVREGSSGGKRSETWLYEDVRPVFTDYVGYGHGGWGYPGYGYSRRGYYDACAPYGSTLTFGTDVHYQPYVARTVEFRGDRVTSWEQVR